MAVVVLDASVVIAFLDADDAHHSKAVRALAEHRGDRLVLPSSAYAEVLVGPFRRGPATVARVERVLSDLAVGIEPLSGAAARDAARLRARHGRLALPDALVLATAEQLDAVALTADRAWPALHRRARLI